jgi:transcriptional regulator of arginine metabolism
MSSKSTDPMQRLSALRELLAEGQISTQEELVEALRAQKFLVTQSTISRDLTRLSAVKARDPDGRVIYKLPEDVGAAAPQVVNTDLKGLLLDIEHNGSMIVIHTTPGSANLLARLIDTSKPEGCLGTIAGDDTIFVAPNSARRIAETVQAILAEFA